MKIITLTLLLLLCFSCKDRSQIAKSETQITDNNKIIKPEFQSIIDSSDVKGSILVYDLNKDIYYSNDFEWSNKGNLPASTFKITNSIIGLETGVIENDSVIFKWDGEKQWSKKLGTRLNS
jgi:beta-lactamase class D